MSTVKSKKLQVGTDATSSNNFTIYQPATPDGTLRIGVGNAENPTEVMKFDGSGNLTPTNGIYLGGTASANLLNDYEEGTWTPTIVGSTGGSATIGALINARYIKIGKQVTIWMDLQSISKNTLSGIIRVSLPFACSSTMYATGLMRYTGFINMGASTVIEPLTLPGASTFHFQSKNSTSYVIADLTDNNVSSTFALFAIYLSYYTN